MSASPWQPAPEPFDAEAAAGLRVKARMLGYQFIGIARTVPLVKQRMAGGSDTASVGWVWWLENDTISYFHNRVVNYHKPPKRYRLGGRRKYLREFLPFFSALKLSIRFAHSEHDCR